MERLASWKVDSLRNKGELLEAISLMNWINATMVPRALLLRIFSISVVGPVSLELGWEDLIQGLPEVDVEFVELLKISRYWTLIPSTSQKLASRLCAMVCHILLSQSLGRCCSPQAGIRLAKLPSTLLEMTCPLWPSAHSH